MPASKTAPAVAMQVFSPVDEAALQQIRRTATPPRVSVLDVIKVITGLPTNGCSVYWNRLRENHPDVITSVHRFPGARQRDTDVADARAICEIVMLLPGKAAASFRQRTAGVLVRYLGGDEALVAEIAANRLAQEGLPESHPMRIFGEAVEAGGVTNAVGACEQVLGRLLPSLRKELTESLKELTESLTETLTVCIDERFAAVVEQQRSRAGPQTVTLWGTPPGLLWQISPSRGLGACCATLGASPGRHWHQSLGHCFGLFRVVLCIAFLSLLPFHFCSRRTQCA